MGLEGKENSRGNSLQTKKWTALHYLPIRLTDTYSCKRHGRKRGTQYIGTLPNIYNAYGITANRVV